MALQSMRDKMAGPVVWGIVGLLCLVFAVWGIGASPLFGGANPTLAKVGDAKITQGQFQQAYNRSYQQMLQMMGDNFNPNQIDQDHFRAGVLNDLIEQTLLQQYARSQGYAATDAAVYDFVSQIGAFQEDGHFSPNLYRSVLASNGMVPDQFEAQVRESLRVEQLRSGVLGTAFVVPKQALATWDVVHATRDASELIFSPAPYVRQVQVSDAQVEGYYTSHKADFIAPQRVKLQYIELAQSKMPAVPAPEPKVLEAIYETQKAQRFTIPEQRKASHILIRFGSDAAAARARADAVVAKLKAGGNFAALARQYSEDPGSKNKGGELGWLGHGMTAPEFDTALFALAKAGDFSAPIKTKFGWDIIRLDDIRAGHVQPFDDAEVQAKLLETYRSRAAAKDYEDAASQLANLVFENPSSLDPAAQKLGLKVETTDWLTRQGGPGIAAHPAVIEAAFSDSVLKDGENSKPITVAAADQVVIRKLAVEPERQKTLAEVSAEIRQQLVHDAAQAQARAAAEKALQAIRSGTAVADAARQAGVEVKKLAALTRQDAEQDHALVTTVFKLPEPGPGVPKSAALTHLASGDYAVVVLDAVNRVEPKAGSDELAAAARNYSQVLAGGELDAYRALMQDVVKIKRERAPESASPTADDGS